MNETSIKTNLDEYERLFLSLGDKTRLRLLTLMANAEVSVGDLVDKLGESQPKVSRHLAYLRNSGVVDTRRDGKCIYYAIRESDDSEIDRLMKFIVGELTGTAYAVRPPGKKSQRNLQIEKITEDLSDEADQGHDRLAETSAELKVEDVSFAGWFEGEGHSEEEDYVCENNTDDGELEVFLL